MEKAANFCCWLEIKPGISNLITYMTKFGSSSLFSITPINVYLDFLRNQNFRQHEKAKSANKKTFVT